MGQRHLIANLTRTEYLDPRAFEDEREITGFGFRGVTMAGLTTLISSANNRAYGDLWSKRPRPGDGELAVGDPAQWLEENGVEPAMFTEHVLGRWAGDRIAIVGDYWQPDDLADWGDGGAGGVWNSPAGWINLSWWAILGIGLCRDYRSVACDLLACAERQNDDASISERHCFAPRVALPFADGLEVAR